MFNYAEENTNYTSGKNKQLLNAFFFFFFLESSEKTMSTLLCIIELMFW